MQKSPLYIEKIGKGPTLVFLHGWMMHSTCWHGLAQDLAADYQCCLIDLPGHGKNTNSKYSLSRPKSFVHSLLLELPENAIWIGWSLGGLLVQLATLTCPARIAALVSISMGPGFAPEPGATGSTRQAAFDRIHFKAAGADHGLLHFIALQTLGSENARVTRKLLKESANPPQKDGLDLLKSTDLYDAMKQCPVPALFITGAQDRITNPAAVRTDVACLPHAEYTEISGAGHAPFLSHPKTFIDVLRKFLCQTLHCPHD